MSRISQEIEEALLQDIDKPYRYLRSTYGTSYGTIKRLKDKAKIENESIKQLVEGHQKPDLGKLPERKIDVLNMLNLLTERTDKHNTDEDYHKVAIATNKPIAVMKAADLHMGGLDVSYKLILEHYKFLLKADGFYTQFFGDDINMMVMMRIVGARHDILTPNEQVILLESMVDELLQRNKIISMGWGNHSDEFTERSAGFGIVSSLMKYKVPYFRGLGYLDLKVGNYTYPMAFAHKTRFNSFMNPVHGNKRMEQMHVQLFGADRPIAREYITAHTHYPAIAMHGCLPEERIYYIKCGTFKTNCLYSQRYFGQGRVGVPTVVYHPDRFEHVCFPTPWEAYRYMTGKDWKD